MRGGELNILCGGIFVDSGTLTIGDGAVIEDNYCPIESASGVVIAEDLVNTVEDYASQIYLSGSPQISDTIYLDEGKSILINGELGDGDVTYEVYQQETDFKLVENGGTAAARYTDESYMNEDDGDKFTVYPYDAEWDFEADTTLDHYTALSSAVTGSSAGIYANYAAIDLSEISYEFTDAYSTDEDGTAQYKYNGFTRKPTIQATAEIGTEDDADADTGTDTGAESAADSLAVRRGNIMYYSYTIHAGEADKVVAYGKATDDVYVGTWK